MTDIEKNLTIAACESALDYVHASANITSLATLETMTDTLRTGFDTDPANVSEYDILVAWRTFWLAQPPSLLDLSWIFKRLKKAWPSGRFDGSAKFDGLTTFGGEQL